ncbi:MAG: hypothetical protein SOU19_00060 [Candidatus Caccosoma sp.]|nr:hypothetical protein [Candidatus Caccosoma sp.]
MKNNFIVNKKLVKYKYLNSYKNCLATHCKMDVILEELTMFSSFNVLVIGVFECSFYSKKVIFNKNVKNYSYLLTDKEIVFASLDELNKTLKYMNSLKGNTLVLSTCIPQINNLNIKSLVNKYEKLILLNVEEYTSCNSYDILSDFYLSLKCFLNDNNINKEKIVINNYSKNIITNLNKALQYKTIIINNNKYLALFNSFTNHIIINNSIIQPLSFYKAYFKELNISLNKISKIEKKIQAFASKYKMISIKSFYAPYIATLFYDYQIKINKIITSNYNINVYNALKTLNDDCLISFDSSLSLNKNANTYNLVIDDEKLYNLSNFNKVCYIIDEVLLWD